MNNNDHKDRWLRGIFVGMILNSMTIWSWMPALFILEPGEDYRNYAGAMVIVLVVLVIGIYGIGLIVTPTRHKTLKTAAIILNFMPAI